MTTSTSTRIGTAVAVGLGMIAVAGPASAAGTPDPKVTTTGATHAFTVFSHGTKMLINGAPMTEQSMATPKPGDKWLFADQLNQFGAKIGTDSVDCTVAAGNNLSCLATETFGNGTLVIQGTTPMGMDDDAAFDIPIVSGTDAYAGATGTMHLAPVPGTHGVDGNLTFTYTTTSKKDASTPAVTKSATTQVTKVPSGSAETGGGSTAGVEHGWLLGLGAATLAAGAGTVALGRRGR